MPAARGVSRLPSRHRLTLNPFVSACDVIDEPKPAFLIDGVLLLHAMFSFFGQPDVGKSLVALLLAVCVATRTPFAGHAVKLAKPGTVVYVAAEGGWFIGARLRAIREAYGLTKEDLRHLHLMKGPVALTDMFAVDHFIEQLHALLRDRPPAVLILFDTLSRCLGHGGADENSPRDMGSLVGNLDAIAEATGAAVGVLDHTGWSGAHERGHSGKRAAVDQAILVTRRDNKDIITLSSAKANHFDGFAPIRLAIEPHADAAAVVVPERVRVAFSANGRAAQQRDGLPDNDRKALQALVGEPEGLSFSRWLQVSDVKRATFNRALQRLRDDDLIRQVGPSTKRRYTLTDDGRRVTQSSIEAAS